MPKHRRTAYNEELFLLHLGVLSLLLMILTNLFLLNFFRFRSSEEYFTNTSFLSQEAQSNADTLGGWASQKPYIHISGGDYKYSSGGLIAIASTDEPKVDINTYKVYKNAKFELFEADRDLVFKYLLYTDENTQINKRLDTGNLKMVTSFEKDISDSPQVSLPLAERGVYYLRISVDGTETNSMIVRSGIGSVVKEGKDEYIFWSQNFSTKRSLSSGNVRLYNLKNSLKELSNVSINDEGIAKTKLTAEADIAVVDQGEEFAIVPINLRYLNYGYDWNRFEDFKVNRRFFGFTDRPLYRPGDTIYFKGLVRDDEDSHYSIPTGTVHVKISDDNWSNDKKPIYEQDLVISTTGSISGEFKLPKDVKTGYYYLTFNNANWDSYTEFTVQDFRKPEYFVELSADKREYIAGDKIEATISGQYFSGQPLANVDVTYKVDSAEFYDYSYFDYVGYQISDDYRYGWWGGGNSTITSGIAKLDSKGQAKVQIDTKNDSNGGKSRVYVIEVHYQDESSDQAFDRKNLLVYPGEFGVYQKNYVWSSKVGEELSPVFKINPHKSNINISGIKVKIIIEAETYEKNQRNYYDMKYEKVQEKEYSTNSVGEFTAKYTPQKEGSYKYNLEITDARGNKVSKTFYYYASDQNYARYSAGSDGKLTLTPDKNLYKPGDLSKIVLYSEIPNRDIFVSFDRDRVNRYQIVKLQGNTTTLNLPLNEGDMPNIYVTASSFTNSSYETTNENLKVSAEQMRIQVTVAPDSQKYKPGDTAKVVIETKDIFGNPVSADVAVWAVDKAIYQLEPSRLGNVFDSFWFDRYLNTQTGHSLEGIIINTSEMGGGCFASGTKILTPDGDKNIETLKPADTILTKTDSLSPDLVAAKVKQVTSRIVDGYLLINGKLKITDNHILLVNGKWLRASDIRGGDLLATKDGNEVVESIEWQLGKTLVYNLEIEKYHTFFADGIYVHNQKGGATRDVLKDTAYWNPSVFTDSNGRAEVTIKLPENLTTWTISALAASTQTKVGQNRTDIIVTKDIIVRPIIPNVLRIGDEINLSALVQNYTSDTKTFNVKLNFANGDIEEPEKQNITIASGETKQITWKVKPTKAAESADIQFIAYEVNNVNSGDNILKKISVRRYGFYETAGYAGDGDKEFKINLHKDSINEDSKVILSLSPTILGALPASMNYLIDYPYGCIEQTTSRFVPSVIVKQHPDLFPELLKTKDMDGIINKGLARLSSLQNSSGGWSWWYGSSEAYISSYVTEYLLEAKKLGYEVDPQMLNRAKLFFENLKPANDFDRVSQFYALTLLGSDKAVAQLTPSDGMNNYLLSMLVIANKRHGVNDNNANGYNKLVANAKQEGNSVFWEDNSGKYFASIDATTAMAIRAILAAGGDRQLAVSAANYLARSRNKHYWSNSYATANVIRALVDLSMTGDEQNPDYTYRVELDGKLINSGKVYSAKQNIKDIAIDATKVAESGSAIKISKIGTGQLYSTLVINEFRTDRNYKPEGKALKITKRIVNAKDEYRTLGIGDVAKVSITVEGIKSDSGYLVVDDVLPSGLVPVIESFKNEQFGAENTSTWGKEFKEDGAIFADSYFYGSGTRTFEYKARVINSGSFWVPPTTAQLMYSPDVNGVSDAMHMTIENDSIDLPRPTQAPWSNTLNKIQSTSKGPKQLIPAVMLIMAVVILIFEKRTGKIRALIKKMSETKIQFRRKGIDKITPESNNDIHGFEDKKDIQ